MTDEQAIRRHRWRLAIPVLIAVVLLGGYTLVWLQGARIMRAEITEWVETERAEGRMVSHGDISVRGYPGSLRAEVNAPAWADPGAWSWQAETLYVITEPLNPSQLVLTPRGEQQVEYGGETYALRADDLRVGLAEGAVAVEASGLSAEGAGQALALGAARVNWAENADGSAVLGLSVGQADYRGAEAAYYVPQLNAALSEGAASDLGLDAFEGAIATARGERPALLAGQGRVGVGADGYLAGRMTLTVRNAEAVTAVLVQAGVLEANQGGMVDMAMAGFASGDDAAEIPLAFRDGKLRVGPLAVADLPQF